MGISSFANHFIMQMGIKLKVISNESRPKHQANGLKQQKGIDFKKIFSPTTKMTNLCCVLALVPSMELEFVQMDVKTMFLHGDLHELIYML